MKKTLILVLLINFFYTLNAQKSPVFILNGKAIRGYDPVAFFTESKPVKGKDSLTVEWNGATWNFSTEKNLTQFKTNPEMYAPQFGGYCAYGTAGNHKAPTLTETWTIINNKLYFNYNQSVKQKWINNQDSLIKQAEYHWITLKDKE
jgi:YHS domain-containing protein